MSRRFFCLLVGALTLSACLPITPAPLPTSAPSPSAAATDTATPAPTATLTEATSEPSPAPSETAGSPSRETAIEPTQASAPPPGWQEFVFSQLSQLAVWFDPALWVPNKAPGQGELDHSAIPNCLITDQWATQPPAFGATPLVLGPIQFVTAQADQKGQRVTWLKLLSGVPNNPYPTQGVTPILIVAAPLGQAEQCLQAAEASLATLHLAPQ